MVSLLARGGGARMCSALDQSCGATKTIASPTTFFEIQESDVATNSTIRSEVQRLADRPTAQVLIVGGGINGLGTFRDLALQGVDVVLVERNDFVSGASAASSHMIHGGIRYLENG